MPADDPVVAPAAPPAPAPEPAAPPVAAPESPAVTSPAAPVILPDAASVAEPAPPQVETPAPEGEPSEPAPKLHTEQPTLMELAGQEEKPGETPIEAPAPVAVPRTYEPFTLPEGTPLDEPRMTAAAELFAANNLTQEAAQNLVDFHVAEMQRYQAAALQAQHDTFSGTRAEWVKQVMADPEIGGSGHKTAMTSIAQMRDLFVSSAAPTEARYAAEMAEFNDFLRTTGAGDHPAFNRLLHNVARRFQEPAAPTISFKPPPDIGRRPNGAGSRRQTLYGEIQSGANGRAG